MRVRVYKSPVYAALWSFACPGFGQIYTGQYILGFIFIGLEIIFNYQSHLNLSLFYTFHGHFHQSSKTASLDWGLFYPSLFGFSMWQAYIRAKEINHVLDGNPKPFKPDRTGFFFGLVAGMNLGLILSVPEHFHLTPSINGVIGGLIGMFIGSKLEKMLSRK